MSKLTIKDVDLKGKKVLMRVDFNVPLNDAGAITDDARIKAALPSIQYLLKQGVGKLILMSHLGRPDGKVVDAMRLTPVAKRLAELLKEPVLKLDDCIGDGVKRSIDKSTEKVIILENLRFHADEERNDAGFARELSKLGEVFVNDAFGTAHRAHASTEGITHFLQSLSGFLLAKEIEYLSKATGNPVKPYVLILGGAKVSDKIAVIENLISKVDKILIGGGMAYTFLAVQGKRIGNSKVEQDKKELASAILKKAAAAKVKIVLPVDHIVAEKLDKNAVATEVNSADIPDGLMGLDIGPQTIKLFCSELQSAKTVVWNGPLGVFEIVQFSRGSKAVAEYLGTLKATTIIGGGDTAAAIAQFGLEAKMSHISTGGGASLEFLEGKVLPGVAALTEKK